MTAQRQEFGVETGGTARAIEDGRFQGVDDDGTRTATKELEGVHDRAIELGLALRERKLDVDQPAVAEHGHEHRNPTRRAAELDPATLSPIDLHGLSRLVVDFLIDTPASGA